MVIKRVSPMSAAKMGGVLGVLLGLVIGACVTLLSLAVGSLWSSRMTTSGDGSLGAVSGSGAFVGMFMGVAAIIVLPIFCGVFSFVMGAIYAALYNLAAKWMGGLEIDIA